MCMWGESSDVSVTRCVVESVVKEDKKGMNYQEEKEIFENHAHLFFQYSTQWKKKLLINSEQFSFKGACLINSRKKYWTYLA